MATGLLRSGANARVASVDDLRVDTGIIGWRIEARKVMGCRGIDECHGASGTTASPADATRRDIGIDSQARIGVAGRTSGGAHASGVDPIGSPARRNDATAANGSISAGTASGSADTTATGGPARAREPSSPEDTAGANDATGSSHATCADDAPAPIDAAGTDPAACADRAAGCNHAASARCATRTNHAARAGRATGSTAATLLYFRVDGSCIVETQERDDVLSDKQSVGRAVIAADRREGVKNHITARVLPALPRRLVGA